MVTSYFACLIQSRINLDIAGPLVPPVEDGTGLVGAEPACLGMAEP